MDFSVDMLVPRRVSPHLGKFVVKSSTLLSTFGYKKLVPRRVLRISTPKWETNCRKDISLKIIGLMVLKARRCLFEKICMFFRKKIPTLAM